MSNHQRSFSIGWKLQLFLKLTDSFMKHDIILRKRKLIVILVDFPLILVNILLSINTIVDKILNWIFFKPILSHILSNPFLYFVRTHNFDTVFWYNFSNSFSCHHAPQEFRTDYIDFFDIWFLENLKQLLCCFGYSSLTCSGDRWVIGYLWELLRKLIVSSFCVP